MKHILLMMSSLLVAFWGTAQTVVTEKVWTDYNYSLSAGFGTQKFISRFDWNIGPPAFGLFEGSHHVYFDLGISGKKFPNAPTWEFNHVVYPSNTMLLFLGVGYGFQYQVQRWNFQGNLGLRYAYVRFTDGDLVEAIGTGGIIRYKDNYITQAGPLVENGYGNAASIDIAARVGYRLIDRLEVNGGISLCPIRFSTANSLFGKHWGEYPIPNSFWVRIFPLRFDVGLRFYFGL